MTGQLINLFQTAPAAPESSPHLVQGLVELFRAVKSVSFYPLEHPYRAETLRRAFQALSGLVEERELVLAVQRQGFLHEGYQVQGNAMVQQLAHECLIRRVASITFLPDLVPGDLEALVQALNSDPQRVLGHGGLARRLEQRGVTTIWLNEKDLNAIWARRGEAGRKQGGEDGPVELVELAEPALPEPAAAAPGGVPQLLRCMARERDDRRYQDLGRQLLETLRDEPGELPRIAVLEELLRQHDDVHKSLPQREYALFTLEHVADGAADQLLAALESRESRDKESIHRILAALGGKGAYWLIQRICLAEGVFQRKALATALIRVGPAAVPALVGMLKDERWYVVRNMVAILGELRQPMCVAALKKTLYHEDPRVGKEVIRALAKVGGEAAEGALIQLLRAPEQELLRHAVLALGSMRSSQALGPLLTLLEKRDLLLKGLETKQEVVRTLGRIGGRRVTSALLRLLAASGWPVPGRWLELKLVVAATLGTLGDEAALPGLTKLAAGRGALAQACREAVDALERVSGGMHD